jgi:hypothetical protein
MNFSYDKLNREKDQFRIQKRAGEILSLAPKTRFGIEGIDRFKKQERGLEGWHESERKS